MSDNFDHHFFNTILNLAENNEINECVEFIENNNLDLHMGGGVILKSFCHMGNINMVKYILEQKNINHFDNFNRALWQASLSGNIEVFLLVLNQDNSYAHFGNNYIIDTIYDPEIYSEHLNIDNITLEDFEKKQRIFILNALFQKKGVKESLINNNINLYKNISKEINKHIIPKKLSNF